MRNKYFITIVFEDGQIIRGDIFGFYTDALKETERLANATTFGHPEKMLNVSITRIPEKKEREIQL